MKQEGGFTVFRAGTWWNGCATGVTFVCLFFFSSHQFGMEFRASSVLEYDDELTGLIKSGSATDGSAHVENVRVSSIGVTNQTDEGVCAGVFHSACFS